MSRNWADFVRTTTASTGTGATVVTDAAFDGLTQSFADAVSAGLLSWGEQVEVAITDGASREVSRATLVDDGGNGELQSRALLSSTTGAFIAWAAGSKHVRLTLAADSIKLNNNSDLTNNRVAQKKSTGWADSALYSDAGATMVGVGAAPVAAALEVGGVGDQLRLRDLAANESQLRFEVEKSGASIYGRVDPYHTASTHDVRLRLFENCYSPSSRYGYVDVCDPSTSDVMVQLVAGGGLHSYFNNGAYLGIGTTSPTYPLHISESSAPAVACTHTTAPVTVKMDADNTNGGRLGTVTNHQLLFLTNNAGVGLFDAGGNFGMGIANPKTIGTWTSATDHRHINLYESANNAIISAQGNGAFFVLSDTGGGADDKSIAMRCDGGRLSFDSWTDAGGARNSAILTLDMGTGNVGIGGNNNGSALCYFVGTSRVQLDNALPLMWLNSTAGTGAQLDYTAGNIWRLRMGTTETLRIANSDKLLDFRMPMANSTRDPTTDAPADWVEVNIAGTTRYLPAYAA